MKIPERILKKVEKPARYTGGEWGQVIKDKNAVDVRFAFCFPDTYEIGMSNLGIRILYHVLNSREDTWAERAYAPWVDMEACMREENIPLWAHESGDPLKEFDILGFSVVRSASLTGIKSPFSIGSIARRTSSFFRKSPLAEMALSKASVSSPIFISTWGGRIPVYKTAAGRGSF